MPFSRSPSRKVYEGLDLPRVKRRGRVKMVLLFIAVCIAAFVLYCALYLRTLSSGTAVSDAQDMVALAVSETIGRVLSEKNYGYDDFVTLSKDAEGNITAITTNTARINLLAAEIYGEIVKAADNGQLDIRIRLGDLIGSNLLIGRGPEIPVKVSMMTSSFIRFENDLTAVGINQSRHTLTLVADVDIDLLVPWGSMHTTVETDILVAETVIVGRVPDTYVNLE